MKLYHIAFAFLFVGLCAATQAFSQKKYPPEVLLPTLLESVEVDAPDECADTPKPCALEMLRGAGIDAGKKPKVKIYRLGERDGKNLTIVFVTQNVTGDDSVAGIRYRLALSLGDVEDRSYKLETLGKQYRCARGRAGWSKELCP